jgi:hypothetical protein
MSVAQLVDKSAMFAAERGRIALVLNHVLATFEVDRFQDEADVPDDRIVTQDRGGGLDQIVDAHRDQREEHDRREGPAWADQPGRARADDGRQLCLPRAQDCCWEANDRGNQG